MSAPAWRNGWTANDPARWKPATHDGDAERPRVRSITADVLQGKKFAPIRWVVPDIIPDGLTIFAGKPKLGKSWLMMDVAITVAAGGFTLGDRKVDQGAALYAALEDNERRLQDRMGRLRHAGATWPKALTFWTEMSRIEEGGLAELERWTHEAEDEPRLIVLDTFAKVRRQARGNEQVYDADYASAAPLKALADRTGVAIVLVHHLRKQAADDPLEGVSGSNGLTGAADTIMVLNRGSEGVTLYGRGRDVAQYELAMEFDKSGCRWSLLGEASEVQRSDERKIVLDVIRLSPDPVTAGDVRDCSRLSYPAARRLLSSLASEGLIKRAERGKYVLS